NGKLLYLQAQAQYGSAKYDQAIQTLEQLIRSGVDTKARAKYSFMLGMAAKRTGDLVKAEEGFKAAMYGPYKPAAQTELTKLAEKG
ncbi:MAG: tetratricopeptide repeat protein, partial [Bacteroidota bacterium]